MKKWIVIPLASPADTFIVHGDQLVSNNTMRESGRVFRSMQTEKQFPKWKAFCLGFVDGWKSPYCLSSGMTWDNNDALNLWYDRGVNLGQFIRSPLNHEKD